MPFHYLIDEPQMNFTVNRALTYGEEAVRLGEAKEICQRIRNFEDWYREWHALARITKEEGRMMNAAYYFRMAEFFLPEGHKKNDCYHHFIECFNKAVGSKIERHQVPYEGKWLPLIRLKAEPEKGTIVVHGGYDSFMEEFFLACHGFVKQGYTLILFEGPGQGQALRNGFKFTHEWEKPVKAVLDYFNLEDVTLIGISWGGFLAPRAAAFNSRISRVVAYDVMFDGLDFMTNQMPPLLKGVFRWMVRNGFRKPVNALINRVRKKKLLVDWAVQHGMYITGTHEPFEFFKVLSQHRFEEIGGLITQDVLLLAGEKDHLIPHDHLEKVRRTLVNARSVKSRMFTVSEGGEHHCQTGNIHLAINEVMNWLDKF